MSTLAQKRKRELLKAGKYANRIRKKLKSLKVSSKITEGVSTDLGDIQEICKNYLNAINLFVSTNVQGNNKNLKIFEMINNDLFIHLNYHLKTLKKPLSVLIKELEKRNKNK